MSKPASKTLTEDQVLLIAKALSDRRRYEILKRLGERPDAVACCVVRDCMDINPATLSHHMKELEIAGLVEGRCHVVKKRTREFCISNIFKRPRLPHATFP